MSRNKREGRYAGWSKILEQLKVLSNYYAVWVPITHGMHWRGTGIPLENRFGVLKRRDYA